MIVNSGITWRILMGMLSLGLVLAGRPPSTNELGLEVRVVGINGEPVEKSSITLWKMTSEQQRNLNKDNLRARLLWREAATGKVWEPIGGASTNDRWQRSDLTPGTYRATDSDQGDVMARVDRIKVSGAEAKAFTHGEHELWKPE